MSVSTSRARLDLSEDEARAVHAGLQEALAARLLNPLHDAAARDVLARLTTKVPSWLDRAPIRGEAGSLVAAEAVLRALTTAEADGRTALTDDELAVALGAQKPAGVSISDVLHRMRRDKLIRDVTTRNG